MRDEPHIGPLDVVDDVGIKTRVVTNYPEIQVVLDAFGEIESGNLAASFLRSWIFQATQGDEPEREDMVFEKALYLPEVIFLPNQSHAVFAPPVITGVYPLQSS